MNIGNQIRKLRIEKKVTQENLAEYLGVSAQAVSKWETNASTPDIALLPHIAVFFGVSIDELFLLSEEEEFERIENRFVNERRICREVFEETQRFLKEQLMKDFSNVRAYTDLALLYNHRARSDHEAASEYAKKVLELEPDNKVGWVEYLEANNGVCGDEWYDNHFEVIRYFKEFLEKNPGNFRGLYAIIENLLADGRYDEAVPYIEQIGEVKNNSQKLRYLGDVAWGKGDQKKAIKLWNQSVAEYPDEWQAYCSRADRFKKLGMLDAAIEDYEKCVEMQSAPHITDGLYSLAQMHEIAGDYESAIKDNERILYHMREDYGVTEGEMAECIRREIQRLSSLMQKL